MSKVTKDDIYKLADLGKLDLSEAEASELQAEISRILEYVNQLSELDTKSVEPTYQISGLKNVWREDEARQDITSEVLLGLAEDVQNRQIKVPKVL